MWRETCRRPASHRTHPRTFCSRDAPPGWPTDTPPPCRPCAAPCRRSAATGWIRSLALQRVELAAIAAADLLDDAALDELTGRWIQRARETGALARLAAGLAFRGIFVDAPRGRLAAARAAECEAQELGEVTGNPGVVPPRVPTPC